MEPLFILAAFSFNLYCQPAHTSVQGLDFRQESSCAQSEDTKYSSVKSKEKITLVNTKPTSETESLPAQKVYALAAKFSPSVSLNKISWINSSLTEKYDPSLSVKIRRAELSGFEALLQVSIPL